MNEFIIKALLQDENNKNKSDGTIESTDTCYREQQVKFAYALINIGSNESKIILEQILHKFQNYEKLQEFEKDFLSYLWMKVKGKI